MFTSASSQNVAKPQFCNQNSSTSLSANRVQFTSGSCNCSNNHASNGGRDRSGSFCTCSSCGKTYENSGDSLSDFDLSVDSAGISGHKCPNSPSVRGCVSDMEGVCIEWLDFCKVYIISACYGLSAFLTQHCLDIVLLIIIIIVMISKICCP